MADPTKTLDKLEDVILKLTTHQLSLDESLKTMTLKLNELLHRLPPLLSVPATSSPTPSPSPTPIVTHKIKLDVPRFDGFDPLGWTFKITQFF